MKPMHLNDLHSRIFQSAVVAIGVTDPEGNYILTNPTWSELLGYSAEEALSLKVSDVTPEEDRHNSISSFEYLKQEQGRSIRKSRRYQRKDGSIFWADLYVSALFDEDDSIIGILGVFVDIDKQIIAEQTQKEMMDNLEQLNHQLNEANITLKHLARRDTLTGLYNRRVLEEVLGKENNRTMRTKRGFGIAIADVDNFKQINDTYGHDCGDIVLKELSAIFLKGIRATDTMGRWGGEEFLFVFPETSCQGAMIVIDRIRSKVERMNLKCGGMNIKVTCTIGLSYHHGEMGTKDMINEADKALYQGKRCGKNKVVCFQDVCTDDN
ncbi:MAG: PAS domain S-box protein [Candidatus Cloacimonetes bacterium HGW-Cloacimonetes-3]|jgi:diguanylate cyclase (GGDEF)-like protein/PAS domain S-box-containing protein|nr:MAG: PAS domain S-box protein [Candidatus Cloacimonetes bacterium HGW-Cloacimonetes-3]